MRNIILCVILIALGTILVSCRSGYSAAGGSGKVDYSEKTTTTLKDGTVTVEEKQAQVDLSQPENANKPGQINISDDKGQILGINTGTSDSSVAKAAQVNGLLQPLIFVGGAMILGAVVIGVFLKQFKWAIALALSGGALIAGTFLLVQYPGFFLGLLIFGVAVALGYGGYIVYRQVIGNKANVELVASIQALKGKLPEDKFVEFFKGTKEATPLVKTIQSDSTAKLVSEIKFKENI